MKALQQLLLLGLGALGCSATGLQAAVTPVQKAVELLSGMLQKAKSEKHEEQVRFAAFDQFCSDVSTERQRAVEQGDERIEMLNANILKYNTEAARLGREAEGHAAEITSWQNDTKVATELRAAERAGYVLMHRNFSESIDALTNALATLKKEAYNRPGATLALLEEVRSLHRLPGEAGRVIEAFLARDSEEPDLTFVAAPEANAYEFRSHQIITMLEQLSDKFKTELTELETEETQRRHTYLMFTQDLRDSVKAAENARASKLKGQAKNGQSSTDSSSELKDVSATRADDAKYLSDLHAMYQQKSEEYKSRQKLRADEVEALEKAVAILSSSEVAGAAEKHLPPALMQRQHHGAAVLAQLRTELRSPNQLRAAIYLREESKRLDSHVLSTIAVRAEEDPFGKVKKLIQELINRLMAQANEEAEHKGWCDTELATNTHTRESKTQQIEMLRAEIDGLEASIASLKKDLAALSTKMAELTAAVANATDLRQKEEAENTATIEDAVAGRTAVAQAIQMLKSFYGEAAKATVLTQGSAGAWKRRQAPPPTFDAPYKGLQAESGGVLGILEVIHSDFVRLESDTSTAEAAAAAEHGQFMEDSSVSQAQIKVDMRHKSSDRQGKEMTLTGKESDLESAEKQLRMAEASYEKLKPACLDAGQSYKERDQRREDEIEALKEALRILSGQDIVALQQQ